MINSYKSDNVNFAFSFHKAAPKPIPDMIAPREAYATTTCLYLPEAYCFDEKSLFRDVDAVMRNLSGETLCMALKHLYIKWGDYCDAGREEFAADMLAFAAAGSRPTPRKPKRQRPNAGGGDSSQQAALF